MIFRAWEPTGTGTHLMLNEDNWNKVQQDTDDIVYGTILFV